jgi:hypothetical protein
LCTQAINRHVLLTCVDAFDAPIQIRLSIQSSELNCTANWNKQPTTRLVRATGPPYRHGGREPIIIILLIHNSGAVHADLEGAGHGCEAVDVNRRVAGNVQNLVLAVPRRQTILGVVRVEAVEVGA